MAVYKTYSIKQISTGVVERKCLSSKELGDVLQNPDFICLDLKSAEELSEKKSPLYDLHLVSGVNQKPDNTFRDILKQVKKGSGRNNSINTF